MAQCLIPGCQNDAQNNISIRLRRPDTSAIWAPNTVAYLCDTHAAQGYSVNIDFVPAANPTITTNVSAGGQVETRTTPIVNTP